MTDWHTDYDSWKLASPDDDRFDDYEEPASCTCEDFDETLEGARVCIDCGLRWFPTTEELRAQEELQREYEKFDRKQRRVERRRELWLRWTKWIRWPVGRLLDRFMPPKPWRYIDRSWRAVDDEIPF
jgi:hypothetical protein